MRTFNKLAFASIIVVVSCVAARPESYLQGTASQDPVTKEFHDQFCSPTTRIIELQDLKLGSAWSCVGNAAVYNNFGTWSFDAQFTSLSPKTTGRGAFSVKSTNPAGLGNSDPARFTLGSGAYSDQAETSA